MAMPQLPPSFDRPEAPQRKLPRRWIDYLRFRKCKSFRSLSINVKGKERPTPYYVLKREKDYALSDSKGLALLFWSAEAIKSEPNPRSGFRVCRAKFALALRVKRALKQFPKDEWVEAFLDQLRVTVNVRRFLSVKFRRWEFGEAEVLDLTDRKLKAMGIAAHVREEILEAVNRLLQDEWVEAFLDQLRVTVNMRRLLSVKFRRQEFRKADILGLNRGELAAIGIAPYERREILHVVNRLP